MSVDQLFKSEYCTKNIHAIIQSKLATLWFYVSIILILLIVESSSTVSNVVIMHLH